MTRPTKKSSARRAAPEEPEAPAETQVQETARETPPAPPTPRLLDRNWDDRAANSQPVYGGRDLSMDAAPVSAAPSTAPASPAPSPTPIDVEAQEGTS